MENCGKLYKNCSIHDKNREISDPYNFWTPVKSNIPDVWSWNFWTFFGSEIEKGGGGGGGVDPPAPPPPMDPLAPLPSVAMPLKIVRSISSFNF